MRGFEVFRDDARERLYPSFALVEHPPTHLVAHPQPEHADGHDHDQEQGNDQPSPEAHRPLLATGKAGTTRRVFAQSTTSVGASALRTSEGPDSAESISSPGRIHGTAVTKPLHVLQGSRERRGRLTRKPSSRP